MEFFVCGALKEKSHSKRQIKLHLRCKPIKIVYFHHRIPHREDGKRLCKLTDFSESCNQEMAGELANTGSVSTDITIRAHAFQFVVGRTFYLVAQNLRTSHKFISHKYHKS